jgi:hypothetical protein
MTAPHTATRSHPSGTEASAIGALWAQPEAAAPPAVPAELVGTGDTQTMALYLREPGDKTPISVDDLHQDGIGDCFLVSSIGELARTDPAAIRSMIHKNSNGTESVTLHVESNGSLPTPGYAGPFTSVTEVVTNVFAGDSVNSGSSQDVVNGVKEIWPQVLEKAVAELNGGYSAISNGGYPFVAMDELTGVAATWLWLPFSPLTLSALQGYIKAGDMITFDTPASPPGYNLVGDHSYMFEGLSNVGGTPMITLGNPWGTDQPAAIPLSQVSNNFVQVDIGHHG